MELCFFLSVDSGDVVLWMTDISSPHTYAGPVNGIPIILNLYLSLLMYSITVSIATNSEPNVLVPHVFCFLDIQEIEALFRKMMKSVLDLLVILSHAWFVPTKQRITTSFPRGSGIFGGKYYFSSP